MTGDAAAGRMESMTTRLCAVATVLLAVTMTACGASQPSSAVSAILLRATNAKGDSIFTIVKSYNVCYACVY